MPSKNIPKSAVKARINALLLKCHLLIAIATDPEHIDDAFDEVSRALYLVEYFHFTNGPFHARALLFRGHCFRALACWNEAAVDYRRVMRCGTWDLQRLAEKCMMNMRLEKEEAMRRQLVRMGRDSGVACGRVDTESETETEGEAQGKEDKMVDVRVQVRVRKDGKWVDEDDLPEEEDSYLLQMARNVEGEQAVEKRMRQRLAVQSEKEKKAKEFERKKKAEDEKRRQEDAEKQRRAEAEQRRLRQMEMLLRAERELTEKRRQDEAAAAAAQERVIESPVLGTDVMAMLVTRN